MSAQRVATPLVAAALLVMTHSPCNAALITFNDRTAFNVAAPGLTLETFETALVSPGAVTTCNGPLSRAVASACFPSGSLAPGVTFSASPGTSMAVLGAGFGLVGNTSKVLGPNAFADTLNLTFPSANAVGLDVFAGPAAGNVLLSVFSPAGVLLLGSFTVAAPVGGTFFGVLSDAGPIGSLNVSSVAARPGELVDNVAFGNAGARVPEPGSVVLLTIGVLAAVRRIRAN